MAQTGDSLSITLPEKVLLNIADYLDGDENLLSLALSGKFPEFAPLYAQKRETHGLVISPKCRSFLTPSSWEDFFRQYISPEAESVTSFNANHCYWLPGSLLFDQIGMMKNLEKLSIKDTQVSPWGLTVMLTKFCPNLTQLEFSYKHTSRWYTGFSIEQHLSTPITGYLELFKNLKSVKISTTVLNAIDFLNDPWIFIFHLLSFCRQCTELKIEVSYIGEIPRRVDKYDSDEDMHPMDQELDRQVRQLLIPKLGWMKSLQSFVLIKLGPFENYYYNTVRSRSLDILLNWMFSVGEPPQSLERLWIQDFYFCPGRDAIWPISHRLRAYRTDPSRGKRSEYPEFHRDLEHFGGLVDFSDGELNYLPNLKSAYGSYRGLSPWNDTEKMLNFLKLHPNLEHLSYYYFRCAGEYARFPNAIGTLLKLKSFSCAIDLISKAAVDDLVKGYPNIEALYLDNIDIRKMGVEPNKECLSAISFKKLISLNLKGFRLDDGAYLLPIIEQCPNLERLLLDGEIFSFPAFVSNFEPFLKKALKLRDFRLKVTSSSYGSRNSNVIAGALVLFNSILKLGSHLERLTIIFGEENEDGYYNTNRKASKDCDALTDVLVKLVLKFERLTCLCLIFYDDDYSISYEAGRRIEKEKRPALWIHIGRNLPNGVDSDGIPDVHYHEMVIPTKIDPPPVAF